MVKTMCDNCHIRSNQMEVRDGEDSVCQLSPQDKSNEGEGW